ncbi:MAG: branched-chain amino acid ABC transporter substrate-binding protein, partial [Acidimicrobiia bacterium]
MKIKRSTRFLAALGALALVAAACGGDTDFEAGELGAVEVGPGESIEIRSLNAISGEVAFLGIPNENAVRMAVEDYGAVAGHSVNVGTGLDDLCSADGGQSAAQTIVADEQVVGVIGTSCSGAAAAASPLISEAGLVMISPSNTSPSLTSDLAGNVAENWNAGYYRTAHNDLFQGQAAANFVFDNLGLTKVALIHDGDPYTNGLTTAFQNAFQELGGEIVLHTAVAVGDTDMVPVLTEVAAAGPELIFFPIFPAEGTFIVQQIGDVAGLEDVVLMGADGLIADNFLEVPESEGMYFSGPDLRFGDQKSGATGV